MSGRVEKRSEIRQTKVSLRRRLNHLLRKSKSSSSVGPDTANTSEPADTTNNNLAHVAKCDFRNLEINVANQEENEEEDGGALSLADLESDQLSPFVTRRAGSTPKVLYFTILNFKEICGILFLYIGIRYTPAFLLITRLFLTLNTNSLYPIWKKTVASDKQISLHHRH